MSEQQKFENSKPFPIATPLIIFLVGCCIGGFLYFSSSNDIFASSAADSTASKHFGPINGLLQPILKSKHSTVFSNFGYCWANKKDNLLNVHASSWGSYSPDLYFGLKHMTTKESITSLSTGLLWSIQNGDDFRYKTSTDELEKFEYLIHNGESYGLQELFDRKYGIHLNTSFYILLENQPFSFQKITNFEYHLAWIQRIDLRDNSKNLESVANTIEHAKRKVLVFIFSLNDDPSFQNLLDDDEDDEGDEEYEAEEKLHDEEDDELNADGKASLIIDKSSRKDARESKSSVNKMRATSEKSAKVPNFKIIQSSDAFVLTDKIKRSSRVGDTIIGYTSQTGYFAVELRATTTRNPSSSSSNAKGTVDDQFSHKLYRAQSLETGTQYLIDDLKNARLSSASPPKSSKNNIAAIQLLSSEQELTLEIFLFDHIQVDNLDELEAYYTSKTEDPSSRPLSSRITSEQVTNRFLDEQESFHRRFQQQFIQPSNMANEFTTDEIQMAERALSSLLGGIGYFQGKPQIADGGDVDERGQLTNVAVPDVIRIKEEINQKRLARVLDAQRPLLKLLTATPSRTSFPRGFLWDEGFHQFTIMEWNANLTMTILKSWLNTLHYYNIDRFEQFRMHLGKFNKNVFLGGWIPREMILGEDARARVPTEFIDQRVNIANPPTLFLVIEKLLNKYERLVKENPQCYDNQSQECVNSEANAEKVALLTFFKESYEPLNAWLLWYLYSQGGPSSKPGTFRWRGRSSSDNKLVPNTLASGLDDYPRALLPNSEEYHLDLLCWIMAASRTLGRLQVLLGLVPSSTGESTGANSSSDNTQRPVLHYTELSAELYHRLNEYHWSEDNKGYFDYGLYDDNLGIIKEMVTRCQDPNSKRVVDVSVPISVNDQPYEVTSYCPAEYPKLVFKHTNDDGTIMNRERLHYEKTELKLQFIPRVGYNNLLPFLLRLIPETSSKLTHILNWLEDPFVFWTEYGIRSLSASDMFYWRDNAPGDRPYWRGPIWINMNYLALHALHHYSRLEGVEQSRCLHLYTRLRRNLLRLILGEYQRTGHFWEQYDDKQGVGIRGHPFTGWTSLVVNIMAEQY